MHKRKIVALSLFCLFLILVGTLLYYTFDKRSRKQQILAKIEYMPDLSFVDIREDAMCRLRDHIGQQPICLIQIDPDCYFCHEQVMDILDKYEHFDEVAILFISPASVEKLEDYGRDLYIGNYPKIRMLYDEDLLFPVTFGTATTPTALIYARDGRLLAKYEGLIKTEKLIEHLIDDTIPSPHE